MPKCHPQRLKYSISDNKGQEKRSLSHDFLFGGLVGLGQCCVCYLKIIATLTKSRIDDSKQERTS